MTTIAALDENCRVKHLWCHFSRDEYLTYQIKHLLMSESSKLHARSMSSPFYCMYASEHQLLSPARFHRCCSEIHYTLLYSGPCRHFTVISTVFVMKMAVRCFWPTQFSCALVLPPHCFNEVQLQGNPPANSPRPLEEQRPLHQPTRAMVTVTVFVLESMLMPVRWTYVQQV